MSNQLTGLEAERGYSYADIEQIAQLVRQQLNLDAQASLDMREFFEFHLDDVSVVHRGKNIPLVHGVEELKTEALTRWDPFTERIQLLLSAESYRMLCNGHPRPKYTIGHELGHALLHTGKLIKLAELNLPSQAAMHRGKTDHPAYRDTEWQANAFSGAFIVPAKGIKAISASLQRTLTPDELASYYGISVDVAAIRLDIYGKGKTGVA